MCREIQGDLSLVQTERVTRQGPQIVLSLSYKQLSVIVQNLVFGILSKSVTVQIYLVFRLQILCRFLVEEPRKTKKLTQQANLHVGIKKNVYTVSPSIFYTQDNFLIHGIFYYWASGPKRTLVEIVFKHAYFYIYKQFPVVTLVR